MEGWKNGMVEWWDDGMMEEWNGVKPKGKPQRGVILIVKLIRVIFERCSAPKYPGRLEVWN